MMAMPDILKKKSSIREGNNIAATLDAAMARPVEFNYKTRLPLRKIVALLATIENQLPEIKVPVIHFTSAYDNEGADAVAFETAYAASTQTTGNILFLCCGYNNKIIHKFTGKIEISLEQFLLGGSNPDYSPFIVAQGTRFFCASLASANDGGKALKTSFYEDLITKLESMFDMIFIYTESALSSDHAPIISGLADGNIIVIEAERTRIPVIRELKQIIESGAGKIIGTILNRRRYYIPRGLYAFLFQSDKGKNNFISR